jgi:hypothetical protein
MEAPHDDIAALMEQGHGGLYAHVSGRNRATRAIDDLLVETPRAAPGIGRAAPTVQTEAG